MTSVESDVTSYPGFDGHSLRMKTSSALTPVLLYCCRYVDQLRGLEAERTLLQEQLESQARAFRQYQVWVKV